MKDTNCTEVTLRGEGTALILKIEHNEIYGQTIGCA